MKKFIIISILNFIFYNLSLAQTYPQKIVPSDRKSGDFFGQVTLLDGNQAFVGVPHSNISPVGGQYHADMGAVYIFKKNSDEKWIETAKITPPTGEITKLFGHCITRKNNFLIIGAKGDQNGNGSGIYIFENETDDKWKYFTKVDITGIKNVESIVYEYVSDGWYLFVGGSSKVLVFKRELVNSNYQWNLSHTIEGTPKGRQFGKSIAASGSNIIIGDPMGGSRINGEAYIYNYSQGAFNKVSTLKPHDVGPYIFNSRFGESVDIEATIAMVGSPKEGPGYIYSYNFIANQWQNNQKITSEGGALQDQFGCSVSIGGSRIIVGSKAAGYDVNGQNFKFRSGSAYLFNQGSDNKWVQYKKIVAPDRAAYDEFGYSVSISGINVLIGADSEDEDANGKVTLHGAGAAYIDLTGYTEKIPKKIEPVYSYKSVAIGDQLWMTENLRTTECSNGAPIPKTKIRKAQTEAQGLQYEVSSTNCNICPTGWRVPSSTDITNLTQTVKTA
jgi:hypothetical protein